MLMAVFLLVVGAGSLCLSGRVVLPGIRRGVLLGIRIDELTDLTHRESLHLFLGDGRVKLLQDQESLILPQRHTGSVRLADQLDVPGMAVDVLAAHPSTSRRMLPHCLLSCPETVIDKTASCSR